MSRYSFTRYGYTDKDRYRILTKVGDRIIFQQERCPSSGRLHLQGYVEFDREVGWDDAKVLLGGECHLKDSYKDKATNVIYCSKRDGRLRGTKVEYRGLDPANFPRTSGGQGRRTDLETIRKKLDGGATLREIARNHFSSFVRYRQSFQAYITLMSSERNWKTEVFIYWGEPGCGKSYKARKENPGLFTMPQQSGDRTWFDGYQGQDVVLWNEFHGGVCPWTLLLDLCDEGPFKVQIKNFFVEWLPKKIIFTSNTEWIDWYKFDENPKMKPFAFERRITKITHFTNFFKNNKKRKLN